MVGTFSLIDPERAMRETMATVSVSNTQLPLCIIRGDTSRATHTKHCFTQYNTGNSFHQCKKKASSVPFYCTAQFEIRIVCKENHAA